MKNKKNLIFLMAISLQSCALLKAQDFARKYVKEGYKLVWSDEFNKNGAPDPANWDYEKGFVRNEELQWYQPENAFCKDGKLIIEARKEVKPNPLYVEGSNELNILQPVSLLKVYKAGSMVDSK
jgi:beta-glucanase (GH16 family)